MSVFEVLFSIVALTYSFVSATSKFLWLQINRWVDQTYKAMERKRNIVVIGDSIAAGFGDWIKMGQNAGVVWRLKEQIAADENIVLKWKLWNCGHFAATSDEWNPSALTPPKYMAWTVGWKPLFHRVFGGASSTAESDVVIVIVGSFDCRYTKEGREVKYTTDNLHAITKALVENRKYVIICHLLDIRYQDEKDEELTFMGRHQKKNQSIYHSQTGLVAEFPGKVFEGANMTDVSYTRPRLLDGVHLNTQGYEKLANELYPILKKVILRIQLDVAVKIGTGKKGK